MSEWQPIETAPRTSQSILVWCPDRKSTFAVNWGIKWSHFRYEERKCWMIFGGNNDVCPGTPEFWMPIPTMNEYE